ncbi:hypothetical protein BDZ89DRAFT_1072774 [Hymenopellis radicata]|nr:hypothetical protein BDZ89DRAFT_1072774 [Hymenopellis radicata]
MWSSATRTFTFHAMYIYRLTAMLHVMVESHEAITTGISKGYIVLMNLNFTQTMQEGARSTNSAQADAS